MEADATGSGCILFTGSKHAAIRWLPEDMVGHRFLATTAGYDGGVGAHEVEIYDLSPDAASRPAGAPRLACAAAIDAGALAMCTVASAGLIAVGLESGRVAILAVSDGDEGAPAALQPRGGWAPDGGHCLAPCAAMASVPGAEDYLVTAGDDGRLWLHSLRRGEALRSVRADEAGVAAVAVGRFGEGCVATAGEAICLWDVRRGWESPAVHFRRELPQRLGSGPAGADNRPSALAAALGSHGLVAGLRSGALAAWDLRAAAEPLPQCAGVHRAPVTAVAFSSATSTPCAMSASLDGQAILWAVAPETAGTALVTPATVTSVAQVADRSLPVNDMALHDSMPIFACVGDDGSVLMGPLVT